MIQKPFWVWAQQKIPLRTRYYYENRFFKYRRVVVTTFYMCNTFLLPDLTFFVPGISVVSVKRYNIELAIPKNGSVWETKSVKTFCFFVHVCCCCCTSQNWVSVAPSRSESDEKLKFFDRARIPPNGTGSAFPPRPDCSPQEFSAQTRCYKTVLTWVDWRLCFKYLR